MGLDQVSRAQRCRKLQPSLAGVLLVVLAPLLGLIAGACSAHAAVSIDYPNFASTAGLTLNGAAAKEGDALRLTPASADTAGSAFSSVMLDPAEPVHTSFTLRAQGGTGDGDVARIAFVIQRSAAGAAAIGSSGDGLGYDGITPSLAIAVQPAPPSFTSNQIMLLRDGDTANPVWGASLFGWPVFGQDMTLYVNYWPQTDTLTVSADVPGRPHEHLFTTTTDLAQILGGKALAGFTAGTASAPISEDVRAWHLDTERRDRTQVSLTTSPDVSGPGEAVELSATVTNLEFPAQQPTGSLQFLIDGVASSAPIALDDEGRASRSVVMADAGGHDVSALYSSADSLTYSDSQTTIRHPVATHTTDTNLSTSSTLPEVGDPVTITATVTDHDDPSRIPGGTVQFALDGASAGAAMTLDTAGTARFTTSSLGPGPHQVTATYAPARTMFGGSSGTLTQQVNRFPSVTKITVRPDPVVAGQNATLAAKVTRGRPDAPAPTGTVQFAEDDGTAIGPPEPLRSDGTAEIVASAPAGTYTLHANYSGDAKSRPSTATVMQRVGKADTLTRLSSSANPAIAGSTITLTATVEVVAPGDVPTFGSLQFLINGSPVGEAIPLDGYEGVELTTRVPNTARSDTIGVRYSGDANTNPSSASLRQVVTVPQPAPVMLPSVTQAPALAARQLSRMTTPLFQALRRRGFAALTRTRQPVTVPGAGELDQRVYSQPASRRGRAGKRKLVASAHHSFQAAGTASLKLRLTAAGRRAGKRRGRLRLTVTTRFTPKGGEAAQVSRRLTVKVRPRARRARVADGPWPLAAATPSPSRTHWAPRRSCSWHCLR